MGITGAAFSLVGFVVSMYFATDCHITTAASTIGLVCVGLFLASLILRKRIAKQQRLAASAHPKNT